MLPARVVGENPPLEILGLRLGLDLALEALGDARHAGERHVVLRHLGAELVAGSRHERFRVGFLDAADEQAEKSADQASDACKHLRTPRRLGPKTRCEISYDSRTEPKV